MKKEIILIAMLFISSILAVETADGPRQPQSTSVKKLIKDYGLLIWEGLKQNWGDDQVINFYHELMTPRQLDEVERARKKRSLSDSGIPCLCCTEGECENCIEFGCYIGGLGCTTLWYIYGWLECPVATGVATTCCIAGACKAKIRQKYGLSPKRD